MEKLLIIINGKGGSGKDTICDIVAKHYKVKNISAIDPIKDIAKYAGWNGIKDDKSRKLLAELKQIFIEYNDLPLNFILDEEKKFLNSDEEIMFVHCRESEEIQKILDNTITTNKITLLIKRHDRFYKDKVFGNSADDDVENFNYDFTYVGDNDTVEDLEVDFMKYFNTNIKR